MIKIQQYVCACMRAKSLQSCLTLCDCMDCSLSGSSWDAPGKNTGVGCHFLLQAIFLTQGLNLRLFMSPALAGEFFTISSTWEAQSESESHSALSDSLHGILQARILE